MLYWLFSVCIEVGVYYFDLLDDVVFMGNIEFFDGVVKGEGLVVLFGVFSVFVFLFVVVDYLLMDFLCIYFIESVILFGNRVFWGVLLVCVIFR